MAKRSKMHDDDLLKACKAEYQAAETFNTALEQQRRLNMQYYLGMPMGDEVDGRSKVVSSDVADVIEAMMPPLVRIFAQSDDAVEFEPELEDEAGADLATKYVRHIFFKDNNGFMVIHDQIKDGLMQKMGVVRWRWDERKETTEKTYSGLSINELALVMERIGGYDKTVEVIESEEEQTELGPVYEVKIRVTEEIKRCVVENVPPENVRIRSDLAVLDDSTTYIGFVVKSTRSDLIERGFNKDLVMALPKWGEDDQEEETRLLDLNGSLGDVSQAGDPLLDEVETVEQFICIDYDGDGVAERRLVIMSGGKVLYNERHDSLDCCLFSPIRIPHRAIGRCPADQARPIQQVNTAIQRNMLDNMYLVNNGRVAARVDGTNGVNMDDLLTVRPGGVVRTKGQPGADIMPLTTPWVGDKALAILEYMKQVRQERTGITQYTFGMDGDSLHDTATGFQGLAERSDERVELIARLYAEQALKRIFWGILDMVMRHQDTPRQVRILGRPVEVDPTMFCEKYGLVCNVGLGTGNKQKKIAALMAIIQKQEQLMAAGSPLVDMQLYHNALSKLVRLTDLYDPDAFFNDPSSEEFQQKLMMMQAQAGQQQELNPLVQAEMIKAQSKDREAAARIQLQEQKQQHEQAMEEIDRQLKQRDQDLGFTADMTELELKYRQNVPGSSV